MHSIGDILFAFGVGGLFCSTITFFVTKHVMENKADEEAQSIIDEYNRYLEEDRPVHRAQPPAPAAEPAPQIEEKFEEKEDIVSITQKEFGTNANYATIYFYSDGTITLGDDDIITMDEVYKHVGRDAIRELSLSSESCVYIRNRKEGYDYRVEQVGYAHDYDYDETG